MLNQNQTPEKFMKNMIDLGCRVSIYLNSGIRLCGVIFSENKQCLVLKDQTPMMVFKDSIASIIPDLQND